MYPLEGATGGGDKLTLKGSNLAEVRHISGVEVECKVDGVLTPASFVGDDVVECPSPPHKEGWVHVEFALNKETSNCQTAGEGFQYVAAGAVKSLFSHYGEAGTVMEVRGDDFKPSSSCRVGATRVDAHFISSTLIRCEAPANKEQAVPVDVSNGVGAFGRHASDVEFQYTPTAATKSVFPRTGNSRGGTAVTVEGRNFANTNLLKCKIGTIETTGVWKSATTIECVAPAAKPTPAEARTGRPVRVSTNQKDFTGGNVRFTYHEQSGVDGAFPAVLPDTGGARVVVHLPLAHPSESPKCRFGSHVADGVLEPARGTSRASRRRTPPGSWRCTSRGTARISNTSRPARRTRMRSWWR